MFTGLFAGITWGIETVLLGIAVSAAFFESSSKMLFLAPFICVFLHDVCSAFCITVYNGAKGELPEVYKAFKTFDGKCVLAAAVIGGPVGMTGYTMAVHYLGPSIGAVASAVYPAIGAVLAWIFLKEKISKYRWLLIILTLLGVYGLNYSVEGTMANIPLGFLGAFMCAFGWGIEAVILAKSMKNGIKDEYALQIRQTTSAAVHGIIVIVFLRSGDTVLHILFSEFNTAAVWIFSAALFATISYSLYYKAIARIGTAKAMALNVTYSAWAFIFTTVFLHDTSNLTLTTVLCTGIVLVCGILAGMEFKKSG